jgi:hypothetical protein
MRQSGTTNSSLTFRPRARGCMKPRCGDRNAFARKLDTVVLQQTANALYCDAFAARLSQERPFQSRPAYDDLPARRAHILLTQTRELDIRAAIVVQTNTNPATPSAALMSKLRFRAYLGVSSSAAGAVLIFFGGLAILPGLAALGVGLAANVLIPRELNELRKVRSQAESSWRSIQDAWTKQPGNKQFIQIKTELNQLVQSLAELPNEERQQIQVLERKKREAQLKRHLDRFLITDATIKKLARGEKQFWRPSVPF